MNCYKPISAIAKILKLFCLPLWIQSINKVTRNKTQHLFCSLSVLSDTKINK